MADIEKAIKGLEFCISTTACKGCPYEDPCHDIEQRILGEAIMRDALELLKEQQLKVLSKEDVAKHDVVWMETNKDEIFPVLVDGATGDPKSELHYFIHLYGVGGHIEGFPVFLYNRTWRCWSNRPTNNVRMNTPWEDGEQK